MYSKLQCISFYIQTSNHISMVHKTFISTYTPIKTPIWLNIYTVLVNFILRLHNIHETFIDSKFSKLSWFDWKFNAFIEKFKLLDLSHISQYINIAVYYTIHDCWYYTQLRMDFMEFVCKEDRKKEIGLQKYLSLLPQTLEKLQIKSS